MMMAFHGTALGLSVLILSGVLCAAPASAQPAAGEQSVPAPASAGAGGNSANEGAAVGPGAPVGTDWVQQQLERLHRQLRISQAQEPLWTRFADTRRANAQHVEQVYEDRSARYRNMNALELLGNRRDIAVAQAADLANELAAFQALYSALGAEQKQAADRIFRYQEERREQRRLARRS